MWGGLISEFGFTFQPVSSKDRPLIHEWLGQPHIREWLHGPGLDNTLQDLDQSFTGSGAFGHWMAFDGEVPFAYLLTSPVEVEDEWRRWCVSQGRAITLDVLICEPSYLGRGVGAPMIHRFLEERFPEVSEVLIDPEESNTRAVRAYEKAGFKVVGEFIATWHPVRHLMMRLDRLIT
jgi:RimJ/RimL family protein N-acetyltransferase